MIDFLCEFPCEKVRGLWDYICQLPIKIVGNGDWGGELLITNLIYWFRGVLAHLSERVLRRHLNLRTFVLKLPLHNSSCHLSLTEASKEAWITASRTGRRGSELFLALIVSRILRRLD